MSKQTIDQYINRWAECEATTGHSFRLSGSANLKCDNCGMIMHDVPQEKKGELMGLEAEIEGSNGL